jgi:hypothetical protein
VHVVHAALPYSEYWPGAHDAILPDKEQFNDIKYGNKKSRRDLRERSTPSSFMKHLVSLNEKIQKIRSKYECRKRIISVFFSRTVLPYRSQAFPAGQ